MIGVDGLLIGVLGIARDITERKQAEEALKKSRFFLSRSQHVGRIGSYILKTPRDDPTSETWVSSATMDDIFGIDETYPRTGETWLQLIVQRDEVSKYFSDMVYNRHVNFEKEYQIIRPNDGQMRWIYGRGELEFDDKGNPLHLIGIVQDITDRKQAEESLRRSESNYRSVIENIQDVFYRSDPQGNLIMASPSLVTLLGYESLDEYFGRSIAEAFFYYPEKRAEILNQIQEKGSVTDYEVVLKRKDGIPVTVETNSHYYYDDAGNVAGVEGIFRNITDRKRAEEALRSSERQMKAIVDGSPIPQFVIDRNHRIIHWNRALEEYSGINSEDVIGTNHQWRAFYDHERPCMADLLVDGFMDKIPQWYAGGNCPSRLIAEAFEATDFFPAMKDGTWLHFTVAQMHDPNGVIIGAVETLDDITEKKRAEEQLLAEKERLSITLGSRRRSDRHRDRQTNNNDEQGG